MRTVFPVLLAIFLAPALNASDKPSITTSHTIKLTAQVTAIDMENHEVSLKGPEGDIHVIDVGSDARRLDEVEIGDTVYAEYIQKLSLEVIEADGMKPGGGTMTSVRRAPDDEAPGMVKTEITVSMASVADINLEANTFQLKWDEGNIKEYTAQDPENLKKAAVGDLVIVTYTNALALKLQELPK